MRLTELIKDWPCTVFGDVRVTVAGVTEYSALVQNGYLFVARKGNTTDGSHYVKEAVKRGATAIVIDRNEVVSTLLSVEGSIPTIVVPDCQEFLAYASAKLAGDPSKKLTIVAVTGTNGKTTVTHFLSQLFQQFGMKTGVIGTLGTYLNGVKTSHASSALTTIPAEQLQQFLRVCVEQQITHVFLEASSIGLEMKRLDYCDIDVGVFLNVGKDHYEEHGGKAQYIAAKKLLADKAQTLVVNAEDKVCLDLVKDLEKTVYYFDRTQCANIPVKKEELALNIPGEHNYMNALAAVATLYVLGIPVHKSVAKCSSLILPEGRMQRFERAGVTVYVDYAHTPDALHATLASLSHVHEGKLWIVFGCGGNRDQRKRLEMGRVAATYASQIILTNDNPRFERPEKIINQIIAGIEETPYVIQMDRKKAIQEAILQAEDGDCILIAGKGHEKTQQIGHTVYPFSDVEEVEQALSLRSISSQSSKNAQNN